VNGSGLPPMSIVVMYGVSPADDSPRIPDGPFVPFIPPADAGGILITPAAGALIPCMKCNRHIRFGTECPFCFATAAAEAVKSPEREAVDAALALARESLAKAELVSEKADAAYRSLGAALPALAEVKLRLKGAIEALEATKR